MRELLQLLQLADSALPIGGSAHSFGLETLTAAGQLTPENLAPFFAHLLNETAPLEATCCRHAYRLADVSLFHAVAFAAQWTHLNQTLSARKPARESREASATLGKRFLRLAASLEPLARLQEAISSRSAPNDDIHLCTAFGLVGGCLKLGEDAVTSAHLQQSLTGLLSACQRLMPVGQNQVMALSWQLKPLLAQVAERSQNADIDSIHTFAPLLDLAGMRHASLPVRLFIS